MIKDFDKKYYIQMQILKEKLEDFLDEKIKKAPDTESAYYQQYVRMAVDNLLKMLNDLMESYDYEE